MKFGMNLLLWSGEISDSLMPAVESLKKMGYDGVELPLFNYGLDYAAWGRRLEDLGLQRTSVTVRGADDNPISPDRRCAAARDRKQQARSRLRRGGGRHTPGWSVPLGAGLLHRQGSHAG